MLDTDATSTSASGAMLPRPVREPALVGIILVGLGTSAVLAAQAGPNVAASLHAGTSAGVALADVRTTGSAIAELRRRSGLTWEQMARLFCVSRRAMHFWASGKAMAMMNEEHLHRILSLVRRVDQGSPNVNRAVLLQGDESGVTPFDLLRAGHYDRAASMVGVPTNQRTAVRRQTLAEVLRARQPLPPADLVSALQDRPVGQREGRPAASVKVRRG